MYAKKITSFKIVNKISSFYSVWKNLKKKAETAKLYNKKKSRKKV